MLRERVGIIGGGVFGLAAAKELAPDYDVVLFESQNALYNATSTHNQARLQEGYLYAPDLVTAQQCHEGAIRIRNQYPEAVLPRVDSFYLFVEQSHFSGIQFEEACQNLGLPLENVDLPQLAEKAYVDKIVQAYLVEEHNVNLHTFLTGLERDAQTNGAVLLKRSPVQGIDRKASGQIEVATPNEKVELDFLINSAGPWVKQVARIGGHDLPVTLEKATFYVTYKPKFKESYAFVFSRQHGGTIIPNPAMGGVVLGHGEINTQVADPDDIAPISGGDRRTLSGLQELTPLLTDVPLESLSPITGVKVRTGDRELRESSIVKHEQGFYSVIGGKLTASLYVAEQIRTTIQQSE